MVQMSWWSDSHERFRSKTGRKVKDSASPSSSWPSALTYTNFFVSLSLVNNFVCNLPMQRTHTHSLAFLRIGRVKGRQFIESQNGLDWKRPLAIINFFTSSCFLGFLTTFLSLVSGCSFELAGKNLPDSIYPPASRFSNTSTAYKQFSLVCAIWSYLFLISLHCHRYLLSRYFVVCLQDIAFFKKNGNGWGKEEKDLPCSLILEVFLQI